MIEYPGLYIRDYIFHPPISIEFLCNLLRV